MRLALLLLLLAVTGVSADTSTCSCAVTVGNTSCPYKFTGSCTITSAYVEPYSNYECLCGPNDEPVTCEESPTPTVRCGAKPQAEDYCAYVYDAEFDDEDWQTYCAVYPGISEPLACGSNNSVKVDYTLSATDGSATCSYSEVRTECDACTTGTDSTARNTWATAASLTSTCLCDLTDASADPWVLIVAACVTDDDTTLEGYECPCGPLSVDCVEFAGAASATNSTAKTTIRVKRDTSRASWSCTGFPGLQSYVSSPPCVVGGTELACANSSGITTNVQRDTDVTDHCRTITRRDICTSASPCSEIPRFDCVMEPWSAWTTCSHTCQGWKTRTRDVRYPAFNDGDKCPEETFDRVACNTAATCPSTGTCGPSGSWSSWSRCVSPNDLQCSADESIRLGWRSRSRGSPAGCDLEYQDYEKCYPSQCADPENYRHDVSDLGVSAAIGGAVVTAFGISSIPQILERLNI